MATEQQREIATEQLVLLRRLAENVDAMLAYWDSDRRCRFANRAYQAWFGFSPESMIGAHMHELLGPIYELNLQYIEGALRGQAQVFEREIPNPLGGPGRYSQAYYTPDVVDGVVRGFFVLVTDISHRKRLEDELQAAKAKADRLATHDYLTGLPNRMLLEDRVQQAIESARRLQHRCALLFIDLDLFKAVNDEHGHQAGDSLLCDVGARLGHALRRSDTLARVGGDEFVVLMPNAEHPDQAEALAGKLLEAVYSTPFDVAGHALTVSLSAGIGVFPDDAPDGRALFATADAALYRAKRAGRNRFMRAPRAVVSSPPVTVDGK